MLAAFIGFEVIRRVSPLLHTPLMSLTNALGHRGGRRHHPGRRTQDATMLAACSAPSPSSPRPATSSAASSSPTACSRCSRPASRKSHESTCWHGHVIEITYLIAAALFILSLKWLSSPATARRGVLAGEIGMAAGHRRHAAAPRASSTTSGSSIALVLGTIIGVPLGIVPMTAVPQRTALSHAFGALAAALVGTAEFYLRAPHVPHRS